MGCKSFSATYLNVLNGVMLVASIVVLAYSAYLASELSDYNEVVSEGAIITPLVFAAFFFLVSGLGVFAVCKRSKCLLFFYLIGAFVITVAVMASGAVLLSFSGILDDVDSEEVAASVDGVEARVIDFELAVYQECCLNGDFGVTVAPEQCANDNSTGCVHDLSRFLDFVDEIPQQLCDALEDVEIDDAPIVGNVTEGGCGNNDPALFTERISEFLSDNIKPLGITNVVLAVIMLLDVIATCVLLWASKDDIEKKDQKKKETQYADQAAPEMAGGDVKY